MLQMIHKALKDYEDRGAEITDKRNDFLAWLRQSEASEKSRISSRDMMNHLMNNLWVIRGRSDLFEL